MIVYNADRWKITGRQARRIVSGGMMLANAVVAAVLLLPYYTVVLIELFDWDDADATPPGGGMMSCVHTVAFRGRHE